VLDPMIRVELENAIAMLADPEVEMGCGVQDGKFSIVFVRRRGASRQPDFRFRNPDRA